MSCLATVKSKLFDLVEELRGGLGAMESAEESLEIFEQWKTNALWRAVEAALMDSYRNGVRDVGVPHTSQKTEARKIASCRKLKAKEAPRPTASPNRSVSPPNQFQLRDANCVRPTSERAEVEHSSDSALRRRVLQRELPGPSRLGGTDRV